MSLSRYPRYPAYKDSGVEWLGEVPAHWEVRRLQYVADVNPVDAYTSRLPLDTEVSFVPMEAVGEYGGLRLDNTTTVGDTKAGYTHFRDNDVLVAKITPCFENGKGALARGLVNGQAFGTTELHVLRPGASFYAGFLFYLSISRPFRLIGEAAMYGAGGQKRISDDFVRNFRSAFPNVSEQRQIATFLDRETARIDALIEKKRKLIELLQEQRAAIITRAVTRGLDPHAPMKNSGVEWLGEIPAHWSALRLKQLLTQIEQGWSPDCENRIAAPEEWGVMKAGCVNGGRFNQMEHKTLPAEVYPPKSLEIRPGDLLMSRASGSRELVGSVAVVRECRSQLLLCDKLFRLYPDDQNDARYLVYALSGKSARAQIEVALSGGSGMANNIAQSVVKDLLLGVPHREEQVRIANFLDHETTRFDSVAKVVYRAMDQLLDLRSSLITAAVTGAIDVRASLDADARIDAA